MLSRVLDDESRDPRLEYRRHSAAHRWGLADLDASLPLRGGACRPRAALWHVSPRLAILMGLLAYRKALHELGLVRGFQWLDGSFLENIEALETRAPRDIDVVTFYFMPEGQTQRSLVASSGSLLEPATAKAQFHVDAYFVQLDTNQPDSLVEMSTYWYSMWSHRRNGQWKGFLQVDLAPVEDTAACGYLVVGGVEP